MQEAHLSSQMTKGTRCREQLAREGATSTLAQQNSYLAYGNFLKRRLLGKYDGQDIRCTDILMQTTMVLEMMRMECLRKLRLLLRSACALRCETHAISSACISDDLPMGL